MTFAIAPTITPTTGTKSAPLTATFTANASGGMAPYVYEWSFGDGLSSVLATDTHTYKTGRTATVSLTAMDSLGATATWSTSYVINPVLVAAFEHQVIVSPTGANSLVVVDHTAGGTAPYTYLWDFGDGTTSTAQNPSHTWLEAGCYVLRQTVTDADGHSSTTAANALVNIPLYVIVTATPALGSEPLTVDFTAAAAAGESPYVYTWDFGDGSSSSGAAVSHTYTTPGIYEVKANVVDALLHDTGGRVVVDILKKLLVDPACIPEKGTEPLPVTFYAKPDGGKLPYTYLWDFGDGVTSTKQNPVHNYINAGYYDVLLTVTDDLGRVSQNSVAVDVNVNPLGVMGVSIFSKFVSLYYRPFTIYGT